MYIYVYIYIYTGIHLYKDVYIFMHRYIYTYIYIYTHVYTLDGMFEYACFQSMNISYQVPTDPQDSNVPDIYHVLIKAY